MVNNRLRFMGMACALAAALLGGLLTGCNNQTEAPATVAGFTSLEDLEGHSVAVINGSTSDVLLSDTNNFAHIRLVRCKTPTELFAAISDSVADCGIIDTVVLTTLGMAEHGLAVDFNLPGGFDVAVAFNPRDEKLCQQFNDCVDGLGGGDDAALQHFRRASGAFQRLQFRRGYRCVAQPWRRCSGGKPFHHA